MDFFSDNNKELSWEKELVRRAQKEPESFSQLYELNYSKIFGYVLKRTANVEIAKDIVSETFVKALKNIGKFKWKNISFSFWLYRIASNEIVNYFRKNKYKAVSLEDIKEIPSLSIPSAEIIDAEEKLQKHTQFLELHQKIVKLPHLYQEVIVLRFFEKKKIEEVAEILGKKEGTVKSLLYRGLKKLENELS